MSLLSDLFSKKKSTEVTQISNLFKNKPTSIPSKSPTPKPETKQPIQQEQEQHYVEETQEQKKQKLQRTIFVGNVKLETKKKEIKKLFQKYGNIQKIWFRSIPVQQNKLGPKASFILKKFQQNAQSMNAYVRFQNKQSCQKAKQVNGQILHDLTLRVTLADQKQLDFQSTIFVGNLPFDLNEQQLRVFFSQVGKIVNIRIIRNPINHLGIGIAYIRYSCKQEMLQAIKSLNNKQFKGRLLRVKKSVQKKKLQKKKLKKQKLQQQKLNTNKQFAKRRLNQKIIQKTKNDKKKVQQNINIKNKPQKQQIKQKSKKIKKQQQSKPNDIIKKKKKQQQQQQQEQKLKIAVKQQIKMLNIGGK